MGREFIPIFKEWANTYDATVNGEDPEYQEVFRYYPDLLAEIAEKSSAFVLEFGSGTGNLTLALVERGKQVIAIEPSEDMRKVAQKKPALREVAFLDGDMEAFPMLSDPIDTIVSSYVFHHLNEEEKQRAIAKYAALLPVGGKVIFGDTMFLSLDQKTATISQAIEDGYLQLSADLQREYYPLIPDIDRYFRQHGFRSRFKQINAFVWLIEAIKVEGANKQ